MQDFINTEVKNNRLDIRVVLWRKHAHIYFRKALKINMQTEDTHLSWQNFIAHKAIHEKQLISTQM